MKQITVCINQRSRSDLPSCGNSGAQLLASRLEAEASARSWPVEIKRFACLGHCSDGPVIKLSPGGHFIRHINLSGIEPLMDEIERFLESDQACV